jgi:hypothetical protein
VDPAKTFAAALALDDLAEGPDAAKGVIKLVEGLTKFNFHLPDHGLGVQVSMAPEYSANRATQISPG